MTTAHRILADIHKAGNRNIVKDPGNAGTINVRRSPAFCPLVSAAAETRTLGRPTAVGDILTLHHKTDGGDITLTVTGGFNEDGDTTFTFSDGGQYAMFISAYDGTNYFWRKFADYSTANLTPTEAAWLDGLTPGTVTASKAVVVDANKDIAGFRFIRPDATNTITAFATGGQASATALITEFNRITICATDGDSVKLPASAAGMEIWVVNASVLGKAADVFPFAGDAINSLAVNLAVRLAPGKTMVFTCEVAGTWNVTVERLDAKYTTRALSSSTANAGDLTGARNVTLNNSGATPGTLTTRTGAQMVLDGTYQVGETYNLRIVNGQGTGVLTLAAGDGNVTLTGTMTMAINSFRDFVVTITGANTLTIQNVGTGTFS